MQTKFQEDILAGIPAVLPEPKPYDTTINHAPKRKEILSAEEKVLAIKNALRYFPAENHAVLAEEFAQELKEYGRIYMYRLRPDYEMYARPIDEYPAKSKQAAAIMAMIQNNLDYRVAQHPHELITYGGNGAVFQNWAQYRLVMQYLATMTDEQTLVMYSGHPLGLFPSHKDAPRVIVTNGMVIPNYSKPDHWEKFNALGVSQYGQMTAGSYMYIGPQGIVHGTTITVMNAARKQLKARGLAGTEENMKGMLFVTAGLGGMSGAQPKAGNIAGVVSITAEINPSATDKRHSQGWVDEVYSNLDELFAKVNEARAQQIARSFAYQGNVVDLWEYAAEHDIQVDLGSDQTSLHNPFAGGYYPVGYSFEESKQMMAEAPEKFKDAVYASLRRHVAAVNKLTAKGMYFFDYGNSFLKAVYDAGVKSICKNGENDLDGFVFPSYVEDILGPCLFDFGYGPFRWCCLSRNPEDLDKTDAAAAEYILAHNRRYQDRDNYVWVRDAKKNKLVVGTQCRILYQDAEGRMNIALKFNEMVRNGEIGPVMLGRDHHDTGGTDSPFRETSNIKDGSNIMAEMATQCYAGNAARGMTMIALHNGGGTGIGKSINGGFGMVLDGSERVDTILKMSMPWDTMIGVSRRNWAGNPNSMTTVAEYNEIFAGQDHITIPYLADEAVVKAAVASMKG